MIDYAARVYWGKKNRDDIVRYEFCFHRISYSGIVCKQKVKLRIHDVVLRFLLRQHVYTFRREFVKENENRWEVE